MSEPTTRNPATLEEARDLLLQDNDRIQELEGTNNTLTEQIAALTAQNEELRTLNQKLFLRTQQGTEQPDEPDEPEETLEEFAAKLKGVIKR